MVNNERTVSSEEKIDRLPLLPSERGENHFKKGCSVVYFQNDEDDQSIFIAGRVEKVWRDNPEDKLKVKVHLYDKASNETNTIILNGQSSSLLLFGEFKSFKNSPNKAKKWLTNFRELLDVKDHSVKSSLEKYDVNFFSTLKNKKLVTGF